MAAITTKDGSTIYYKDWGTGQPVVFSHSWPLDADAWDSPMLFLGQQGYRVIAHDRRGHGRSSQPWVGNEMDTYADDLAALFEVLDIKGAIDGRPFHGRWRSGALPGPAWHQAGGEGRADRGGAAADVEDGQEPRRLADLCFRSNSVLRCRGSIAVLGISACPSTVYNRPNAKISEGVREFFWLQGMLWSASCLI